MRHFTDSAGTEWTVFEVKRQGNEEDNWAYLPRGFRFGWLCFESGAGKRRLSPVPDGWKAVDPADLERMMRRASTVTRTRSTATRDDLDAGSKDDAGLRP
jgi:hypothetical protein